MPVSRRYSPEWAPGDSSLVGIDASFLLPPGTQIASATLTVFQNTFAPAEASADFTVGNAQVAGRTAYALLSGGTEGTDYQLRWKITDTDGSIWNRTALMLCSQTS